MVFISSGLYYPCTCAVFLRGNTLYYYGEDLIVLNLEVILLEFGPAAADAEGFNEFLRLLPSKWLLSLKPPPTALPELALLGRRTEKNDYENLLGVSAAYLASKVKSPGFLVFVDMVAVYAFI